MKHQEEDFYAMQQDFHKELQNLMALHNINIDQIEIMPFKDRV